MKIEITKPVTPKDKFRQSSDGDIMIITSIDEEGPLSVKPGEVLINVQGNAVGFDGERTRFWEKYKYTKNNVDAIHVRFLAPGESITLTQREEN